MHPLHDCAMHSIRILSRITQMKRINGPLHTEETQIKLASLKKQKNQEAAGVKIPESVSPT